MFRSGVFWMGLVFIPVTSLVFDVAYKVWVSRVLFRTTKGKSTGCLISPKEIPEFKCRPLKMFTFPSCENASRNIDNIAAPGQPAACNNLKSWVVFPVLSERRLYQQIKYLKCHDEASVAWQGEEGVFQDPGGWSAGAGSVIQRPWSSSARKEVLSGATTLDLYFTLLSEPEWLKVMLRDVSKCFSVYLSILKAHRRERKRAHHPDMGSDVYEKVISHHKNNCWVGTLLFLS